VTSALVGSVCLRCRIRYNGHYIVIADKASAPNVGAPTGDDALYLTDGTAVYGLTLSATGQSSLYRTNISSASWSLQ